MPTLTSPQITEANKLQFQQKGYFILENVLTGEELDHLRSFAADSIERMHRRMDEEQTDVIGLNRRNSRYFVGHSYRQSAGNYNFIFGPLMESIGRATLGDTFNFFFDQYVIKAAEKGAHFSWHQDSGYVGFDHEPYITCWVTLDDVSEENGTVYLLPFDKLGIRTRVEHIMDPQLNDKVGYFGDEPGVPVIAPAGSVAVFSSVCFHRSGANQTNQQRRVLVCQYSKDGIVNPFTEEKKQNAIPFIENGGRVVPGFEQGREYLR